MDFEDFSREIGFSEDFIQKLMPHRQILWEHSAEDVPFFMEKDFYTRYYPFCNGPDPAEIYPLMEEVCRIVRTRPAAARYASMLHYAYYVAKPMINLRWPSPEGIFGRNAGIFQLMIAMSALPLIEAKHAELKLPVKYFLDECKWLCGTIGIYAAAHEGYPGHTMGQCYWLRYSVNGELFRIGRLEYLPCRWEPGFPAVYRNRKTGSLAVLCLDGWAFDAEGFRVDPAVSQPSFTTSLTFFDGKVTGTPISPYGKPVRDREMTLVLSEWEPLCTPWESCMTIHIPGGGGMTSEAIRNSLIEARMFYHRYLKQDMRVFTCSSWILNPAWERELPESNMADFQRNCYMTPPYPPGAGRHGIFFIYGDENCDPRTRPQTSRLHQVFCRMMDRGEPLRWGAMFIPADEVEHYGTEYYRKNWKD